MIILEIIVYILLTAGVAIVLMEVCSVIRNKWILWRGSWRLKKIAKTCPDPDLAKKMNELSALMKKAGKEEKMFQDDDE